MATGDHGSDPIRTFWTALDSAWRAAGSPSAEEISLRLQAERHYSLAEATIRGWLDHKGLPRRNDDFAEMCLLLGGRDRADEMTAALTAARRADRAARRAAALSGTSAPPASQDSAEPVPSELDAVGPVPPVLDVAELVAAEPSASTRPAGADTVPPTGQDGGVPTPAGVGQRPERARPWSGVALRSRPVRALVGLAAVLVLTAVALLAGTALQRDDERQTGTPMPPPAADRADSTGTASEARCPTEPITVRSRNEQRAHATFCPDRLEFLLSDDSPDGKSAVLAVRVDGREWSPYFNSGRHATRSPDGSVVTKNPPKRIQVPFGSTSTVEIRVCVADRNRERTYPENTCGTWTRVWPQRA